MTIDEVRQLREKRNRGKAAPSEHQLQAECVRWFRYTHRNLIIISIPNGAKRTRYERVMALAEGLTKGIPDLFIPHASGPYHGLWIEMKNGKVGRLSDDQKEMIPRLRNENYAVEVARNMDEFIHIVETYLATK